ncbi:MAG: N-acetylmuramoyl-L-alanine amidase [Ruminococcaceae bacterium]|nr:N-acetylmuramoyl-L-alanine amidase [Oscillospiraceae bacterium]
MVKKYVIFVLLLSTLVVIGAAAMSEFGSAIAAWSDHAEPSRTIVIDAGHGGEDGGAIAVTGQKESQINLEISLRLRDFLHLLGIRTEMIRTSDRSVYTEGNTIAQKKVSDIRHRVAMVEDTPGAVLISIHQNHFSEEKYRGAQVFFGQSEESKALAQALQAALKGQVDPNNRRECKPARNIYLMEHVHCTAALIECGFLSNYAETQQLLEPSYQKKLSAAIGCCIYNFLEAKNEV